MIHPNPLLCWRSGSHLGELPADLGDRVFEWGPRDTFVVPSWHVHRHEALEDAVLFSFSDRPVQEKLGLWREARGQ